jgi:hypothetical protein
LPFGQQFEFPLLYPRKILDRLAVPFSFGQFVIMTDRYETAYLFRFGIQSDALIGNIPVIGAANPASAEPHRGAFKHEGLSNGSDHIIVIALTAYQSGECFGAGDELADKGIENAFLPADDYADVVGAEVFCGRLEDAQLIP